MADNIAITAGTGTTVSTEEVTTLNGGAVSAQHIQRVLPATRTADGTAIDEAAGAGAVTSATKRVTLASDDPAVTALQILDNAISGSEMQVDVVAPLPAGTNNIGDVDILTIAAGDNNIGNVDVVTVNGVAPAFGSGARGATVQRVTIATDDAIASVALNSDVRQATASNLNAQVVGNVADDAADSGNPVKVAGVFSSALPTLTDGDRGHLHLTQKGSLDVHVRDVVGGSLAKAEDASHSSGDYGIMDVGVRVDTPNASVAANGDYHYKATDMVGGVRTALYETDFAVLGTNHVKKYYTNAGAVTDGIIWSPAAGKRWYVTDLIINVSAAATVTLEDDLVAGDSAVMKFELAANSGIAHHFATPLFSGEDAADLLVTTSAGNVYICITGYEI